ncbi:MAG: DUF3164 family protein [Agriterribacter sp.]
MAVNIQTKKDKWTDAAGNDVPQKFLLKSDKVKEAFAGKIYKQALAIEAQLNAFHEMMREASEAVLAIVRNDYELKNGKAKKQTKGAFTWFNYDRSLKVESDVNDIVKWNTALLSEAHELLKEYITGEIGETNVLIKGLVNEAFATSRGEVDSRKIFQILKWEDKVNNKKFSKACGLLKQAQTIDKTKLYMRVWEKQQDGQYRNINLNFSSL